MVRRGIVNITEGSPSGASNSNNFGVGSPSSPNPGYSPPSSTVYYAYVVNTFSGTVSVIKVSTNTVVATVSVGSNSQGVAVTPDGNYAYVTNSGSNNVSVIQISTNTVIDTVTVGSGPRRVAITPDGSYVYVVNALFKTVSVIQTSTNTVIDTVTVGSSPQGVAITP